VSGFNLSDWALKHRPLVLFFMLTIVVAGVGSYSKLGRNEDPAFTIKTMVVQVNWPGATISDTLGQVTDRIEKKLQETPGLDYIKSYTVPGQTTVFVNLLGSVSSRDVPDIWYQVRKKIGDIRSTLPAGIVGPFFNDEFGDTYGIIYGFTADGFTSRELRDYVEGVRSDLLGLPDVSKIDLFGTQDEKIYIEYSPARLAGLNLDRTTLLRALAAQNAVTPAGLVRTADDNIQVEVSGGFRSEADLRNINFVANGRIFRLSDIATVRRGTSDPPQPMFRVNGIPAIGLGISMRAGGDVLALGRNVQAAMAKITGDLPIGIEPHLVADQPRVVEDSVNDFMEALWEAIGIVLAVSFLALSGRAGAVVALSIPLVLAAVFVAMEVLGIDLQRVSLGALIIALGLLVDDAMITVEMMVNRLEAGWDRIRAATHAYTSTAFPMLTGTLVTVAGFVPVGFAKSAAGEYTFSLFAVVAIALVVSWVVAVTFAPLIGVVVLPAKLARHETGPGRVLRAFRRALVVAMRARWITIALAIVLLLCSVFALRFVPQQFFPPSDRPELLVNLTLPQSAAIYATERTSAALDAVLKDDPDIDHWSSYVGQGAVRFYLPLDVQLANDFFAQTVVVTKSLTARERVRARLDQILPERFPQVVARISALELGPPVGWPVQFRVSGPEPNRVRDIAYDVSAVLADNQHVQKINFNWAEPMRVLRLRVNQDQARLLGVSSEALAQAVNLTISGSAVTQVRDGIYLVDVIARADAQDRVSLDNLRTLQVQLPGGKTVPLIQVASLEYETGSPLIWRRDRLPTLTVQADVLGSALPATVVAEVQQRIADLNTSLPTGYRVVVGGTVEDSAKSQASVAAVFPIATLIMLTLLMIQLQSFSRVFLVLSVAPFGIIGVVAALLVSGRPLGFVALLGIVALVGMIVRNSVILVVQIEEEIAHDKPVWDAVLDAATHRFRPILLTAAAAILGMIPIAPTVFWGPMAFAIMGGLAVATALTLIFLPALYVAWFRVQAPERHRLEGVIPEPVAPNN
jgi:multidrug efflux pump subunit AcrB